MKLVFDAGSTKTEIGLVGSDNDKYIKVDGINPAVLSEDRIREIISEAKSKLQDAKVTDLYYYGAGCATEALCKKIEIPLREFWQDAKIEVASDMTGAARGLLGHTPGIACILGTGSNSALFDGKNVIRNVAPLGFILGDEGSGTAIGKRLLGDIFKGLAPDDIIDRFLNETGLNKDLVIERVYRGEAPNKFLASFAKFVGANIGHPYLENMVGELLGIFLDRNVRQYPQSRIEPIGFVGSIAWNFREILEKEVKRRGWNLGKILRAPMEGLLEYHLNEI